MKKILLGTSALAAASLVSGAASAGAEYTFDGSVAYEYIFYDNSNRTASGAVSGRGHAITANEQQSELHWTANGTADNGLEYTGRIDWRVLAGGGSGGGMDESWVKLGGGWGAVVLGQDDGAESSLVDANSQSVGPWGTDGNNLARHQNNLTQGTALYYFSPAGATSDANKIAYYTPDFGGFSAAASFTPTSGTSAQNVPADTGNENVGELMVQYSGDLGGVGLTLGAAVIAGKAESSNGTELENIRSYHLGGGVSFGDFGIAAGWIDSGDSGTTKGSDQEGLSGYNLGASYSAGDLGLSVVYQHTENNTGGSGVSDNEYDIVSVAASYTVAEGLSTYAQYSNSTLDLGADSTSSGENDANVLILGTKVSF